MSRGGQIAAITTRRDTAGLAAVEAALVPLQYARNAHMPRLSDVQLILLATAAAREDGSLLPPPDTMAAVDDRIAKAVVSLIKRKLAVEQEASSASATWRTDGDLQIGVIITDTGRAAIACKAPEAEGVIETAAAIVEPSGESAVEQGAEHRNPPAQNSEPGLAAQYPKGKLGEVVTLLRRKQGATLDELVQATGWLPHTTRAALTGLRQKGHLITRTKVGDASTYRLGAQA